MMMPLRGALFELVDEKDALFVSAAYGGLKLVHTELAHL